MSLRYADAELELRAKAAGEVGAQLLRAAASGDDAKVSQCLARRQMQAADGMDQPELAATLGSLAALHAATWRGLACLPSGPWSRWTQLRSPPIRSTR